MTSPGLQHTGEVGLEAIKIIQSNSGYSGFALKSTSYDNSPRIITKWRILINVLVPAVMLLLRPWWHKNWPLYIWEGRPAHWPRPWWSPRSSCSDFPPHQAGRGRPDCSSWRDQTWPGAGRLCSPTDRPPRPDKSSCPLCPCLHQSHRTPSHRHESGRRSGEGELGGCKSPQFAETRVQQTSPPRKWFW